jgi:hypothetical protein
MSTTDFDTEDSMAKNNDSYVIEPTGRTVVTRHGAQPEYRLLRNGTCIATDTLAGCERERDLRIKAGRNPLRGIGGQIG